VSVKLTMHIISTIFQRCNFAMSSELGLCMKSMVSPDRSKLCRRQHNEDKARVLKRQKISIPKYSHEYTK